jgi:hypothetical protein
MSVLSDLHAKRAAAKGDFDYVAAVYRAAADAGEIPEDHEAAYTSARAAVEALDNRIIEVDGDERREAKVNESRQRIESAVPAGDGVKSEPRTYGWGSPNSYVLDRVRAAIMGCPGQSDAIGRLNQHAAEQAGEIRLGTPEGKRALRELKNVYQENENKRSVDEAIDRARVYTSESRSGLDTTSASGGSFVTPQYYVNDYAPYRQFGRTFIDQCNKQPLPDYGMTIYIPQVTAAATVNSQANQNSGISETDPVAAYLSQSLTTNAGQVTVSQQLLDRAGPNFQYDVMVFDQLDKAYNLTVDVYALTQALANAGSVTYSTPGLTAAGPGAGSEGSLYSLMGKAVSNIATTAGTVMAPTHAFIHPTNWAWNEAQTDTQGRLLVTQNFAGPVNAAVAGGDGKPVAEGDTGYKVHGLPLMTDANIPTKSSNNQAIVANMAEVYVWEGSPVDRVVPQTYAQNLSVLFQRYAYIAAIVRYPTAVQSLNGAGLPTAPTF